MKQLVFILSLLLACALWFVASMTCARLHAAVLRSPKHAEFPSPPQMSVPPPLPAVALTWSYQNGIADSFNVYWATNVITPLSKWLLLTNMQSSSRSLRVIIKTPEGYFTLTASNHLGESDPATK